MSKRSLEATDYLCSCGHHNKGNIKLYSESNFAYLRCQQCGYPCPDHESTSSRCPICKKKQPTDMPAVCILDVPTDVFRCIGCKGVVPANEFRIYKKEFARLAAIKNRPASPIKSVPMSKEHCLFNHPVQCNHINCVLYIDCPQCGSITPVGEESSDAVKERVGKSLVLCTKCDQSDYRRVVIEDGNFLLVKCCRQYKLPNWPSIRERFTTTRWGEPVDSMPVEKIEDLQVGDHIYYQRKMYDHHALVSAVDVVSGTFSQIHYTEGSLSPGSSNSHVDTGLLGKGVVLDQEQNFQQTLRGDPIFVIVYAPLDCYSPSKVITRAQSRLDERCYNLVTSNCEHLVQWCKVGEARSGQVDSIVRSTEDIGGRTGTVLRGGIEAVKVLSDPAVRSTLQTGGQIIGGLFSALNQKARK